MYGQDGTMVRREQLQALSPDQVARFLPGIAIPDGAKAFAYQMTGDTRYSNKLIELAQEMIRAQSEGPIQPDNYYPSRNLMSVLAFIYPSAGALAVVWLIATYAIVFGVVMLVLGFRLRSRAVAPRGSTSAPA